MSENPTDTKYGSTGPLHLLAGNKSAYSYVLLRVLLEKGSDPNQRSDDALTPVHVAAAWGQYEILKLLLQNGGNPLLEDFDNKTALDLAYELKQWDCLRLMKDWTTDNQNSDSTLSPNTISSDAGTFNANDSSTRYTPKYFTSPFKEQSTESRVPDANDADYLSEDISVISEDFAAKKSRFKEFRSPSKSESKIRRRLFCCSPCGSNDRSLCVGFARAASPPYKVESRKNEMESARVKRIQDLQQQNETLVELIETLKQSSINCPSCEKEQRSKDLFGDLESTVTVIEEETEKELDQDLLNKCFIMNNNSLRRHLTDRGVDVGPLTSATKTLYARRLTTYLAEERDSPRSPTSKKRFSAELERRLAGEWLEEKRVEEDVARMVACFDDAQRAWREGQLKKSFCYLLVDPSLVDTNGTETQMLRSFVEAVFYVGKGTKSRPHQHLKEAAQITATTSLKTEDLSEKTRRILKIWEDGMGVVSLDLFHNIIPVEAYTREAAIIDAIRLSNLTNVKRGDYYGVAATWTPSRRRGAGVHLLQQAFTVYAIEGQHQLRPQHVLP